MQANLRTSEKGDQRKGISVLLGGSLIGLALARFSRLSWILGLAGAYLVYCGLSRAEGEADQGLEPTRATDIVHEASEESFPASDPPSWTTGSRH